MAMTTRGSQERKMQTGRMPKTLDGLVAWYAAAWNAEIATELHGAAIWHDFVSPGETANGRGGAPKCVRLASACARGLKVCTPWHQSSTRLEDHFGR